MKINVCFEITEESLRGKPWWTAVVKVTTEDGEEYSATKKGEKVPYVVARVMQQASDSVFRFVTKALAPNR